MLHRSAIYIGRALLVPSFAAACGLAAIAQVTKHTDAPDPDPTRFDTEIAAFEKWDRQNSFPRDSVLFVGSSSIRMWPTAESFPDVPIINRGFGGSHISDVNHFAERIVVKYQPRVIVFYAGDNDIEAGKTPQQVFDDLQKFANLVHKKRPQTRIAYLPIKPSLARWTKWPRMQEANRLVKDLAKADKRIISVDTTSPMLDEDGRPRVELFLDDGLHLNEKGYALWTTVLTPILHAAD